jgi:hypothetical protein
MRVGMKKNRSHSQMSIQHAQQQKETGGFCIVEVGLLFTSEEPAILNKIVLHKYEHVFDGSLWYMDHITLS